jgi:thiosulfate/3-mercaptopyruvate sulfurtransferase
MSTHPTEYAHPEALVETDWLEKHLKNDGIRIIESNEDILLYDTGIFPMRCTSIGAPIFRIR